MTNQESIERLCDRVVTVYKVQRQDVTVVFAPYRICPLGAHIDHQLGRVTAMALDRGTLLAFAPQTSPEVRMRSLDFEGEVCVPLGNVAAKREGDWGNYLRGAVRGAATTSAIANRPGRCDRGSRGGRWTQFIGRRRRGLSTGLAARESIAADAGRECLTRAADRERLPGPSHRHTRSIGDSLLTPTLLDVDSLRQCRPRTDTAARRVATISDSDRLFRFAKSAHWYRLQSSCGRMHRGSSSVASSGRPPLSAAGIGKCNGRRISAAR